MKLEVLYNDNYVFIKDLVELIRLTGIGPDTEARLVAALEILIETTQDFTDSAYTTHDHRQHILMISEQLRHQLAVLLRVGIVALVSNLVLSFLWFLSYHHSCYNTILLSVSLSSYVCVKALLIFCVSLCRCIMTPLRATICRCITASMHYCTFACISMSLYHCFATLQHLCIHQYITVSLFCCSTRVCIIMLLYHCL